MPGKNFKRDDVLEDQKIFNEVSRQHKILNDENIKLEKENICLREALEKIRRECGVILTYWHSGRKEQIEAYDEDKVNAVLDRALSHGELMES